MVSKGFLSQKSLLVQDMPYLESNKGLKAEDTRVAA
jgi:hypothetical protein